MKCKQCDDKIGEGFEYGGSVFCYRCLSEHINDDLELRELAIDEWITGNCHEVKSGAD